MSAAPLLDIAGLTVSHRGEVLLSNLSFSVERGTLHALVGPNGAGKTTLLSAILGQAPFAGRITANWSQSARIGYVPQAFHVDRSLPVTVSDFLALTRQPRPVCFGISAVAAQRIARLLDRVGLAGFERRPLSVLSGGELRRVLLANALDPLPELLLLDEPAAGLDARETAELAALLLDVRRRFGITMLLVDHDMALVMTVCDFLHVLDFGRLISSGIPGAVREDPEVIRAYLGETVDAGH